MRWKKKFKSVRPPIDPADLQTLRAAHIEDMEQLQDRFYGEFNGSLRDASHRLHVGQEALAGLIAKSLVASSEPLTTSWTRRHWANAVILLAIVYVVLAFLRPWGSGWLEKITGAVPAPEARVVATGDIPIYGMIQRDGLRVMAAGPSPSADQMMASFIGRYALAAIPAGTTITESKLSRKPSDISGQSILQIEIKRAASLDGRDLPEDVDLLFSARQGDPAGITLPGRLLALDTKATPPLAAVALAKDKADEAAKWIGSSDVYLSLRER